MKNAVWWSTLLLFLVITSCKSKEEKVSELIKDDMFKTLFDFSSYEPVETKIDSAYLSVYEDSAILVHAYQAILDYAEFNKFLGKAESAQSSMSIWGSSYSSYGSGKYETAKKEAKENVEKAQVFLENINKGYDEIKNKAKDIKPEFCGWKVTHKFRCKNKGGNFDLANYLYIFDKDVKNVLYKGDLDDKDYIRAKEIIDEALASDSQELEK